MLFKYISSKFELKLSIKKVCVYIIFRFFDHPKTDRITYIVVQSSEIIDNYELSNYFKWYHKCNIILITIIKTHLKND